MGWWVGGWVEIGRRVGQDGFRGWVGSWVWVDLGSGVRVGWAKWLSGLCGSNIQICDFLIVLNFSFDIIFCTYLFLSLFNFYKINSLKACS